jgi:hypothetical protein
MMSLEAWESMVYGGWYDAMGLAGSVRGSAFRRLCEAH